MAHPVHGFASRVRLLGLVVPMLAVGCIIPPSLSVDNQDAGTNSPPVITSLIADDQVLPDSGTVNFDFGTLGAQMVVTLLDSDAADTLYVRAFVNYSLQFPDSARAQCADVEPTGSVARTCSMDISNLCPSEGTFYMTVQVFDRSLSVSGVPAYKRMDDPAGLTTNRSYNINCQGGEP